MHVFFNMQLVVTTTGTHMPYGITQYYLPPVRDNIPAFIPAN